MTRQLKQLLRDERGANMIEFAIALPVLVLFIYGIFVVGLVFQANAGMQHALGEAARHATLFPTPTDDEIKAKITAGKFGLKNGVLSPPVVATSGSGDSKTITLTYSQPTDFLFFPGPTVTLTRAKKVYLSK